MMTFGILLAVSLNFDGASVQLKGYEADRFAECIERHVGATDTAYLTEPFRHRSENRLWQTEFWGKYMHAAAPLAKMSGSTALRQAIDRSAADIVATQDADGYIGNYSPTNRADIGWDIWGHKYTLMGLLLHYEATGNAKSLQSARRLADYLLGRFGSGKPNLSETGSYVGLPSLSVLEPIVRLYRATKDDKYLQFANYIVSQMEGDGPRALRLIGDALAGVEVADRTAWANDVVGRRVEGLNPGLKAYEMMSCYQGMLDLYEVTGERRLLEAAVKTAESIVRTELNVVGGCASVEHWYRGAENQVREFRRVQETCVLVTWMRLCAKLLEVTGESRWADELEKTFYNAYLAALKPDGTFFASYTPLCGTRSKGQYHCRMHTNCCNANGPRGFLSWCESIVRGTDGGVDINFYVSGNYRLPPKASRGEVELEVFTLYPHMDYVEIVNRTAEPRRFALRLRLPGWSKRTVVKVGNEPIEVRPDSMGYLSIDRLWSPGETVGVNLDLSGRAVRRGDFVAFARGPIVLARDSRFNDGDLSEQVRWPGGSAADVRLVQSPNTAMRLACTLELMMGMHDENPQSALPRQVNFCDYASAANTWDASSFGRVWMPVVLKPQQLSGNKLD